MKEFYMKIAKKTGLGFVLGVFLFSSIFLITTNAKAYLFTVDNNFSVEYEVIGSDIQFTLQLSNSMSGWMSIVFHEFLFPADALVAWYDQSNGQAHCWDTYNPGIPTLPEFPSPLYDDDPTITIQGGSPYNNVQNYQVVGSSHSNGITTIICKRKLVTQDIFDFQIYKGRNFHVKVSYSEQSPELGAYFQLPDIVNPPSRAGLWLIE